MKLLMVHAHPSATTKYINPLRYEGWGVLCVKSLAEADQVLQFHGRTLDAVVIHREQSGVSPEQTQKWFEQFKKNQAYSPIPIVIMSALWNDRDILKQQNEPVSANAYLKEIASINEFKRVIENFKVQPELKKVVGGESAAHSNHEVALEEVSGLLSRPEITRPIQNTSSIKLGTSSLLMGGAKSATRMIESRKIVEVEAVEPVVEPVIESVEFEPEAEEMIRRFSSEPAVMKEFTSSFEALSANNASTSSVSSSISGDVETMKKYLSLREQDVALLTGQARSFQERILQLEEQLKVERVRSVELQHSVQKQEHAIANYDQTKQVEMDVLTRQVENLNQQLKEKTDKVLLFETKLKHASAEVDKIKERVRVDIRRIRVREKELESQLEILKKDSSALLLARDEKIIELKRKLDLLEFNMELVQEQYSKARDSSDELRQRLKDAASSVKLVGGMLEHEN